MVLKPAQEMICMVFSKKPGLFALPLLASVAAVAQNQPAPNPPAVNENGAIVFYADSGWSFGLPAVRAAVSIPGVGSAISPEKKTLIAPSFGVGVTAWKFVVPFVDFTVYDTGKATATVGSLSSQVQADTLTFNAGARLVGGKSKVRGYAEFGGGVLYQNLKGTFYTGGQASPASGSASVGSVMYGAGMQLFAGRKWGADLGFDGFHVGRPVGGAGQNFSRFRVGVFYQTKSAIP
jgi:hypothetical protein